MPLASGKSKKVIEKNTETEIKAGKSPEQAYAIANAEARRSGDGAPVSVVPNFTGNKKA